MKERTEGRCVLGNCRQGDEARAAGRRNEVTPFGDFFYGIMTAHIGMLFPKDLCKKESALRDVTERVNAKIYNKLLHIHIERSESLQDTQHCIHVSTRKQSGKSQFLT